MGVRVAARQHGEVGPRLSCLGLQADHHGCYTTTQPRRTLTEWAEASSLAVRGLARKGLQQEGRSSSVEGRPLMLRLCCACVLQWALVSLWRGRHFLVVTCGLLEGLGEQHKMLRPKKGRKMCGNGCDRKGNQVQYSSWVLAMLVVSKVGTWL